MKIVINITLYLKIENYIESEEIQNIKVLPSDLVLRMFGPLLPQTGTLFMLIDPKFSGDYSCLKVRLHFTRDKWFYYTTVFMPGQCFSQFLQIDIYKCLNQLKKNNAGVLMTLNVFRDTKTGNLKEIKFITSYTQQLFD